MHARSKHNPADRAADCNFIHVTLMQPALSLMFSHPQARIILSLPQLPTELHCEAEVNEELPCQDAVHEAQGWPACMACDDKAAVHLYNKFSMPPGNCVQDVDITGE